MDIILNANLTVKKNVNYLDVSRLSKVMGSRIACDTVALDVETLTFRVIDRVIRVNGDPLFGCKNGDAVGVNRLRPVLKCISYLRFFGMMGISVVSNKDYPSLRIPTGTNMHRLSKFMVNCFMEPDSIFDVYICRMMG